MTTQEITALARSGMTPEQLDEIKEYRDARRFVLRNGQIMEYARKTWDPKETPHFVSLLILPGN